MHQVIVTPPTSILLRRRMVELDSMLLLSLLHDAQLARLIQSSSMNELKKSLLFASLLLVPFTFSLCFLLFTAVFAIQKRREGTQSFTGRVCQRVGCFHFDRTWQRERDANNALNFATFLLIFVSLIITKIWLQSFSPSSLASCLKTLNYSLFFTYNGDRLPGCWNDIESLIIPILSSVVLSVIVWATRRMKMDVECAMRERFVNGTQSFFHFPLFQPWHSRRWRRRRR